LLNLWLLKVMLRCINDVFTTKNLDIGQLEMPMWCDQMSSHSRCSLCQEKFTFGEHPRKLTILNSRFEQWNTGGWGVNSVMVLAAISWYSILLVPLLPFMAKLLQGNTWIGWLIGWIPWSRCYLWISQKQLEDVLQGECCNILLETIQNLCEPNARRNVLILKTKGGPTLLIKKCEQYL
jgi:hypothetical protein